MTKIKILYKEKVTVLFETCSELVALCFFIFIGYILIMITTLL